VERLKRLVAPHLDGMDATTVEHLNALRWVEPLLPPEVRFALPAVRASNNWVVAPARSRTRAALACFDPHLEVNRLPAVWYEAILHTPEDYRIGITMPGVPGIVMGRTRHLAFGFTYGFMDMIDFFIEDCRHGRCRRGDGWSPIEVRSEQILRRGSSPAQVFLRSTSHGALESDPLRQDLPDGLYLARAWSNAVSGASPCLEAMSRVPLVRSVEDAQILLREVTISCNWLIADARGGIGYQQSGRLPLRSHSGLYPVPGWRPDLAWRGWADPSTLHSVRDPEAGYLATANELINPPGGPVVVNLPMGSYRVERIRQLLETTPEATAEDMRHIQLDLCSLQAERFMELFEPHLPDTIAGRLLRRWDGRYDPASRGATLFEEVYSTLLRRVFGEGLFGVEVWDALGEHTTILTDYYHLFDDALLSSDTSWWGPAGRETVLREVLEGALGRLDPRKVEPWGRRQRIIMENIFFGGRLPRWLGFDRGPIPLPGNRATIVQGAAFTIHGHRSSFAPSWRFIADMGSKGAATCLSGGPSGTRFSRFYASEVDAWLSGKYKRLEP
jgi:penicillin amidase